MTKRTTKAKAEVPTEPPREKVTNRTPSPQNIKEIGGSGYYVWDMAMIDRVALTSTPLMIDDEDYTKKMAAIALRSFEPADAVEGMLASQAVALHFASLECSRRAMHPNQPADIASKLRKDAANSARAMVEMTEAIQRRRGKDPQVVRVERVIVNEGGQAVVGHVAAGTPLPAAPPAPPAIGQGMPPMPAINAEPVTVGRGECDGNRSV